MKRCDICKKRIWPWQRWEAGRLIGQFKTSGEKTELSIGLDETKSKPVPDDRLVIDGVTFEKADGNWGTVVVGAIFSYAPFHVKCDKGMA